MCGIIGCSLNNINTYNILKQLSKLEYRGYDSCGVTDLIDNQFFTFKSTNRISDLINKKKTFSNISIAHTRWATHGDVSLINAHPINSNNNEYSIVHNGIIENYLDLKDKYLSNFAFNTQTDTEVIVNLFELLCNNKSQIDALHDLTKLLIGNYAIIILERKTSRMYFLKNKSPLLIGKGDNIILASDILAFNNSVNFFYRLDDYDYGYIDNTVINIYHNKQIIEVIYEKYKFSDNSITLSKYNHFMEKEIYEIKDLLKNQIERNFSLDIIEIFKKTKKIILIASGTSYHAGLLGEYFFKHLSKIESYSYISSEFEYHDFYNKDDLFIVISQSGETADLIKIVNILKQHNHLIISLTNSDVNTISSLTKFNINIDAGIEIAVASTKTYTLSSFILYKLACLKYNLYNKDDVINCINELDDIYQNTSIFKSLASKIYKNNSLFFLGSNIDYLIAKEASLKLKEISYIHSECLSSGELKHGSISLVTNNFPIIYFISSKENNLSRNSISEVTSRNASVYVISSKSCSLPSDYYTTNINNDILSFIPFSVILQFISYYTACLLNNDIDKPRNLAKSVTVL